MKVNEVVKLLDGRTISLSLTEQEYYSILSAGVHFLVASGLMGLREGIESTDDLEERQAALEEIEETFEESIYDKEETKH